MQKTTFIKAINNIEKQYQYNEQVSQHLSKAFPNAFAANLLPETRFLTETIIDILTETMDDKYNLIDYFCYELDFGKHEQNIIINQISYQIKTPEELYNIIMQLKGYIST